MRSEDRNFLIWLANRLMYKHNYSYDNSIIQKLLVLSNEKNLSIKDEDLDLIISRYYTDFFLDKTEHLTLGYTKEQRKDLRLLIRSLVCDIMEYNLPNLNSTIK